jgi:hypothetical protein
VGFIGRKCGLILVFLTDTGSVGREDALKC